MVELSNSSSQHLAHLDCLAELLLEQQQNLGTSLLCPLMLCEFGPESLPCLARLAEPLLEQLQNPPCEPVVNAEVLSPWPQL